jgi:hypothetical protein
MEPLKSVGTAILAKLFGEHCLLERLRAWR